MSKQFTLGCLAALALAGCQKQTPQTDQASTSQPATPRAQATPSKPTPPAKTYDGPFGLASGIQVAELQALGFKESESVPNVFNGKPPKPAEGIDEYMAVVGPKAGVCRVAATVLIDTVNGSGDQIRAEIDRLSEAMQTKYGKFSRKFDLYGEDVYRRNPQYWMLGLKEDSVAYGYSWQAGKTPQPLPNDIKTIEISAGAASTDSGYVNIRYTFTNFDLCQKEFKERKAANF